MNAAHASPLRLNDNRVPLYYKGGERISRFRGVQPTPGPEDWVGSTCSLPREMIPDNFAATTGVSHTAVGPLSEVVASATEAWLGPALAATYEGNPGFLVKLLDAGERLPVHCHPTRSFARKHLASCFGKTEGWIIMEAAAGASVWLGMREEVDRQLFQAWIDQDDTTAMLNAMNELPAGAGDVFYIPAGLPHAIGSGILVTELQEPVTLSISANHHRFGLDEHSATIGLGWPTAIQAFDLQPRDPVQDHLAVRPNLIGDSSGEIWNLFPAEADSYFRARRVLPMGEGVAMDEPSFCVVIVNRGYGALHGSHGRTDLGAGQTYVVPYQVGCLTFTGDLDVTVCMPPDTAPHLSWPAR